MRLKKPKKKLEVQKDVKPNLPYMGVDDDQVVAFNRLLEQLELAEVITIDRDTKLGDDSEDEDD